MVRSLRPRRAPRTKPQLQSPLLRLPPEIRIQIYQFALIRDEPLDLWPHKWTKPDDDVDAKPSTLKVRHQESLQYVRKEMSIGLLGTCRQVFNEAATFFWSHNRFRFSGRSGWQGLLRFFLTIGPEARSRIQRVDVHAPIYMRWPVKDSDNKDLNGRSKNFPKLHMVQIPPEGHLDRQAIQRLYVVLAQDRSLKEINFIIPEGFRNGDEDAFGGYTIDHDMEPDSKVRIERVKALDWVKMRVVVERGGYLAVADGPQQIMDEGWDLICEPGSFIWEEGSQDKGGNADYEKHEVTEMRTWTAPDRDFDYLIGVRELLEEIEKDSEHANGGKHLLPTKKVERVLEGFNGCTFIESNGNIQQLSSDIR
ncbi:Prostaglandin E synthase 3 (Cytosolic) [Lecanora helva]